MDERDRRSGPHGGENEGLSPGRADGGYRGQSVRSAPAAGGANGRRVEDSTRDSKVATADFSGSDALVNFENILSQLLSQWSFLKSQFAYIDVDALIVNWLSSIPTDVKEGLMAILGISDVADLLLGLQLQLAALLGWVEDLLLPWLELQLSVIFQALCGVTPQVCSAAATLDFDLDNITLSAVKSLVLGVLSAVIDAGPSDSQIDAIAVALVEKVFKVSAHSSRILNYMACTMNAFVCF